VKGLQAGQGTYGFLTSAQGKILADVAVLALADRLWLELPAGVEDEIAAHLRKYVVTDRVEIRPLPDLVALLVVGPRAKELLADGQPLPGAVWEHRETRVGDVEARVVRQGRCGVEAFALWVPAAAAGAVGEALLAAASRRGIAPAGRMAPEALERARVEAGIGRFGRDFGPANFPQETGEEREAVSYDKGCYLGQEVVARIHYRGGVQHALRGLLLPGAEAPPLGTPLLLEQREVGRLTSAVLSSRLGRPIGLAMLHRRGWEPGTRLRLPEGADGGEAEVVAPPFAS
jgi:folate-binding protein YgfZ